MPTIIWNGISDKVLPPGGYQGTERHLLAAPPGTLLQLAPHPQTPGNGPHCRARVACNPLQETQQEAGASLFDLYDKIKREGSGEDKKISASEPGAFGLGPGGVQHPARPQRHQQLLPQVELGHRGFCRLATSDPGLAATVPSRNKSPLNSNHLTNFSTFSCCQ